MSRVGLISRLHLFILIHVKDVSYLSFALFLSFIICGSLIYSRMRIRYFLITYYQNILFCSTITVFSALLGYKHVKDFDVAIQAQS